jgi:hypothetical protein
VGTQPHPGDDEGSRIRGIRKSAYSIVRNMPFSQTDVPSSQNKYVLPN